jgi:hypothetical protein
MPPLQAGKSTEVAIRRDPLATAFARHGREERVGDQIALCARINMSIQDA